MLRILIITVVIFSCNKNENEINSKINSFISENKFSELEMYVKKHDALLSQENLISLLYKKQFVTAKALIKHIRDINGQDSDGVTALMATVLGGELDLAYDFLKIGANPFLKNNNGRNVFDYLLYTGNPKLTKDFLYHFLVNYEKSTTINADLFKKIYTDSIPEENIKNIMESYPGDHNIFLCFSLLNNDLKLFTELLKLKKNDKDTRVYSNLTLYNLATAFNKKEFLELMFRYGFDFLETDPLGFKPIEYAFTFQHKDLIERYLKEYIRQSAQSDYEKKEIKKIEKGKAGQVSINNLNKALSSYILLYFNMRQDNHIIMKMKPAKDLLSIVDLSQRYPLSTAASYGNDKLISYFLKRGADPNQINPNTYKTSPLMEAAMSGNVRSGEILIEHGAIINMPDKNNDPALNYAVFYNHVNFVKMLINKKARITMKGQADYTPLMTARANGYKEMEKVLLKAGAKN